MNVLVRTFTLFALLTLAYLPSPADAGWKFWQKEDAATAETAETGTLQRRLALRVKDDDTERELLTFLRSRELVTRDIIVLRRLAHAKQAQFADIQARLKNEFGILPTVQYEYDSDTRTIYEAATKDREKKEFVKLADMERGDLFLELLGLKRRLDIDILVLQRIEREQTQTLGDVQATLLRKYGVRSNAQYQYDKPARSLYEILPPPQPAASPNEDRKE